MFSDLEGWQPVGWSLGAWRVCDWGGWNVIKGCLQKEFWRTLFLCVFCALNYQDSAGRTEAEIVPCSAGKTFTLFLIPFCFLSCVSWFLCSLLSPLRTTGELLPAPKGSCWYSTRVSDTGSCSLGTWFGGTWQCWVCGCLNDLKALFQPKLFCDSLI